MSSDSASSLLDDGFSITPAEAWVKGKVSFIQQYLNAYVGILRNKVEEIVFVDLSAGNGLYSLGSKTDLFAATSLMAPAQDIPISKFILCDKDEEQLRSLKVRVNKYHRGKNVLLLDGKTEDLAKRVEMYIPKRRRGVRVAVFCVIDPFSIDFPFEVLLQLAEQGFDFLIPFTFPLNDLLNYQYYFSKEHAKLKRFIGPLTELKNFEDDVHSNQSFYKAVVQAYDAAMLAIDYSTSLTTHKLDSGLMELPAYQIGFYSKRVSTKAVLHMVDAKQRTQF